MKKNIFLILIMFWICACESEAPKKYDPQKKLREAEAQRIAKDFVAEITSSALWDTAYSSSAPVVVISSRLVKQEYSNRRDLELRFKNVSGKTVSAIRFRWYGLNAFNEPADMGDYANVGFGAGQTDSPLRPGKTNTGEWGILSKDAKKIVRAWAYEVVFSDGTKWRSSGK